MFICARYKEFLLFNKVTADYLYEIILSSCGLFCCFLLQIGKTKVFLRAGQMADLDTRRSEVLGKAASIIQRKVRTFLACRSFVLIRLSVIKIQAACRGIYLFPRNISSPVEF